jgi:zinc protease
MRRIAVLLFCVGCAGGIPRHPEDLALTPRVAAPPRAENHRTTLAGRIPAYLGQDAAAPALKVTLLFKAGSLLDPAGKEGLAEAAAALFRTGGTERLSPEELDIALEDKAIDVRAETQADSFSVSVWGLARNADDALALLAEMLRTPRVDAERLAIWKSQKTQALRALHDQPDEILRLYWRDLCWGKEHALGRRPSRASVEAITADDIKTWLATWLTSANCIAVATSSLPVAELKATLEKRLDGWQGLKPSWPDIPTPPPPEPPGIYFISRALQQCAVRLGHLSIKYGSPEHHAFLILSEALGGGSFQSRLTSRVRVKEGLTYGITSQVVPGWMFPGTVVVQFNTDAPRAARALALTMDEISRLAAQGLPEVELALTKQTMTARFAGMFESLHGALVGLAMLEYQGRPLDFYTTYVEKIRAVTNAQIAAAAADFLKPKEMRILIAGDLAKFKAGAEKEKLALESFGPLVELPIRDPMQ